MIDWSAIAGTKQDSLSILSFSPSIGEHSLSSEWFLPPTISTTSCTTAHYHGNLNCPDSFEHNRQFVVRSLTWGMPAALIVAWLKNVRPKCSLSGKTSAWRGKFAPPLSTRRCAVWWRCVSRSIFPLSYRDRYTAIDSLWQFLEHVIVSSLSSDSRFHLSLWHHWR